MDNNPPQPTNQPPQDPNMPPAGMTNEQPAPAPMPSPEPVQSPMPATDPIPTPAPQPMPAPGPTSFAPPVAPVGSSPGGNYSPKKGPGLGLILGIIGGIIGLIILVVGGIFVATALLGVSKQDYQTAYDTATAVRNDYADIGGVYISSYSTSTEIANGVDTIKTARTKFETDYKKLSELKAIKADAEVAAEFKKLSDKKPKFDAAMDATVEAYEKILPAVSDFSGSGSATSRIASARKAFEGIGELKDANNKEFVANAIASLTKMETLAAKVQAGRADYRKYDSGAVSAFYDAIDEFTTATKNWQSNLTKLGDDGEIADEINSLGRMITKKLNEK